MALEPDAQPEAASTEARLSALEAENERLRAALPLAVDSRRSRGGGARALRSIAATLCLVIGVALVPAGVLVSWAKGQLVDEDRFVQTFAVLADQPAIQQAITERVTQAIDDAVDIDGLTKSLFDGIGSLGLPERAGSALNLLRGPAASGVRSMIENGVGAFVDSEAFASAWQSALRVSHRAFVAAVTHEPSADSAVRIDPNGQISVQLGPVIDGVKQHLIDQGIQLAGLIPTVQVTIPLVHSDLVPMVALIYSVTTVVGWWLPVVVILLLIGGVSVAPRRGAATMSAGVGLVLGAGLTLTAFAIAEVALRMQAGELGVSAEALAAFYTQVVAAMRDAAVVIALLGVVVFVLGFTQGESALSKRFRAWMRGVNVRLVTWGANRGLGSDAVGVWLRRLHWLTRSLLAVLLVLGLIVFPFSGATIAWLTVAGLLVWWVLALAETEAAAPERAMPEIGSSASGEASEETDQPVAVASRGADSPIE